MSRRRRDRTIRSASRRGSVQCMSTITPMQEQDVVAGVPKGLFIGGEWRDGDRRAERSPSRTRRPARRCARSPTRPSRTRWRRSTPRVAAQAEWAAHAAARARRDPAPRVRGGRRARRRAGAADDAGDGQAAGRVARRGALRRRLPALVLRGGRARSRAASRPRRTAARPDADDAPAGRAVPADHAVELPAGDGHAQDRPGRSPPAARWSSSRPSRRRCRCSRSRRSSRRPGCPTAC